MNISNLIIKLLYAIEEGSPIHAFIPEFRKFGLELFLNKLVAGHYLCLRNNSGFTVQVVYHVNGTKKISVIQEKGGGLMSLPPRIKFKKYSPEVIHDVIMTYYIDKIPELKPKEGWSILNRKFRWAYLFGVVLGGVLLIFRVVLGLPLMIIRKMK